MRLRLGGWGSGGGLPGGDVQDLASPPLEARELPKAGGLVAESHQPLRLQGDIVYRVPGTQ